MEAVAKKPTRKSTAKPHVTRKPAGRPRAHKPEAKPAAPHVERVSLNEVEREVKPAPKVAHGKHYYAVGRRKTSVAQALLTAGNGTITVNQLPLESYFQTLALQQIVRHPLTSIGVDKQLNIKVKVHGGGIHSQAEALRHAVSRGLIAFNPESRRTLKKLGFLTRDPRVKERKKPGLKRARRAPQFSKR